MASSTAWRWCRLNTIPSFCSLRWADAVWWPRGLDLRSVKWEKPQQISRSNHLAAVYKSISHICTLFIARERHNAANQNNKLYSAPETSSLVWNSLPVAFRVASLKVSVTKPTFNRHVKHVLLCGLAHLRTFYFALYTTVLSRRLAARRAGDPQTKVLTTPLERITRSYQEMR